jgi:mono/diheme cytochrome c family protein
MVKKIVLIVVVAGIALFALMQLVPLGRDHTNPPVVQAVSWDSPQTEALVQRACMNCHSNQTEWPWYSNVAPASWLLAMDVADGRDQMNFSDWGERGRAVKDLVREVERGSMPPGRYLALHPEAKLSAEERAQLIEGLQKSLQ